MAAASMVIRPIEVVLDALGLHLRRTINAPSMKGGLERTHRRGTQIRTVFDVGASNGSWSALAMPYFPRARYMLVEAQRIHERALRAFTQGHANARYVLAAAGDQVGTVYFEVSEDPFGGRASHTRPAEHGVEAPMTTLDTLAHEFALPPPYCIKLDTHGFEVPILHGAAEILAQTSLVVVECYNYRFADNLLLPEMCGHMLDLGFRCVDLVDVLYRQRDRAFWQADLLFVPANEAVFTHNQYSYP